MSAKRIRELALSNSPTAQVKKTTATFDAGEILRGVQSQPDKRIQNSWSIALLFVICVTVVWELRTGLALSPFQLGAQRIEEGFFHPQQPHRVARPMAEHAIALLHRHADLSINAEERLFSASFHPQFNLGPIGDDEGPMGQGMGTHGRHNEGSDRRHEHRAAGREGIRRGAGRGSNDDAVGLALENENAIDEKIEIHEPRDGALVHYRIVQGEVMRQALAAANQSAIEHRAFFAGAVAGIHGLQCGVHLAQRNFRQEPERAQIDGQDGNTFVGNSAGSGEQGTVATEDQSEIWALGADLFSRHDLLSIGVSRRLLVEIKLISALTKPGKQLWQDAGKLGLRWLRDDGG